MFELEKDVKINDLIAITKSNSGVSGPALAKAHMELGKQLGQKIVEDIRIQIVQERLNLKMPLITYMEMIPVMKMIVHIVGDPHMW